MASHKRIDSLFAKNKLILKHLIGMKCNNDKNKNLYSSISGILNIFKQNNFFDFQPKIWLREDLNKKKQ